MLSISSTSLARASSDLAKSSKSHPESAKALAVALPIPLEAPVINTVDKKLYFEDSSGNIQEIKDSTTLAAEVQADTVALAIALG